MSLRCVKANNVVDVKSRAAPLPVLAMLGGVTTQHESLLWTLEEISHLVSHSGHPEETLDNIVQLIQRTFDTDVCSVYLLEPDRATLVLAATVGLRPDSVGRVRMRLSEGLAGLVGEQFSRWSSKTRRRIRGSNISARPAKIRITRFSASRSSTRGCCRACSSCRRSSRARSAPTPCACSRWPERSSRRS